MEKQAIREEVWRRMAREGLYVDPHGRIPPFPGQNKAAERLRRTTLYKKSLNVMVPPDQAQLQVRINLLQDRKRLIMATPGLRNGFYEIPGSQIPPPLWARAVSSFGATRHGRKLATTLGEIGRIDLMVTGAVAVSLQGDLREIGSVFEGTPIVAIVDDLQVFTELPREEKDVSIDLILTPTRSIPVPHPRSRPKGLDWPFLQPRDMRRMRPLRELTRPR
jgi:5-formyltetrahydrofolate cyclo-ligase